MGPQVFVDLDLTLIDHNDEVRPHILEFFQELRRLDCIVVVWSAGGIPYVEQKIRMIEERLNIPLRLLIDRAVDKHAEESVSMPAFFVDDEEPLLRRRMREGHGIHRVPPYDSTLMHEDTALLGAAEAVKQFIMAQAT